MSNVLIKTKRETNTREKVVYMHFKPEDLSMDTISSGILVDASAIPEPTITSGKQAVLYYNPVTVELWYEYVDVQLPVDEQITQLKVQLEDATQRLATAEADNLTALEAIAEVYEMALSMQTAPTV